MDIHWQNPNVLFVLWLLLPLAGLLIFANRKRQAAVRLFASPIMSKRIMPASRRFYSWIQGTLLLLSVAMFCIAAARPRWGVYFENVTRRGADLIVLLDVSRSMLSQDLAPSRLARAKSDIKDLLNKIHGERIGLIAFAGKPAMLCPLTTDHEFFRLTLDQAWVDSAPRGGTAIGDAIRDALQRFPQGEQRDKALVLITDGEDHESFPLEAAAVAAQQGVRIFTVGMGDPKEGARIPMETKQQASGYVKYKGEIIWSKMDENLLRDIALKTQAAYVPVKTSVYDLGEVYSQHLAKLTAGEINEEKRKRYSEQFQWFVGWGLAFYFLQMFLAPFSKRAEKTLPLATALLVLPLGISQESPHAKVQQGIEKFQTQDWDAAMNLFEAAGKQLANNQYIAFDKAVTLQAKGDLQQARNLLHAVAAKLQGPLVTDAQFNLGCSYVEEAKTEFGENPAEANPEQRQKGVEALKQAILHFRSCLELDSQYTDARKNLEILRLWLKHMNDVWAQKDKEKQRQELDPLAFLELLMNKQKQLRSAAQVLLPETDSPLQREALHKLATAQELLAQDVPYLRRKLDEGVGDQRQAAQALNTLHEWIEQIEQSMQDAAYQLEGFTLEQAIAAQTASWEQLFEIWKAITPFEKNLQRDLLQAQEVVRSLELQLQTPEQDDDLLRSNIAELHSQVLELSSLLAPKAEQALQALQQQGQKPNQQAAPKEQAANNQMLQEACELAIKLAPDIMRNANDAQKQIAEVQYEEAKPAAEETLRLLKEIAEKLKSQNQQPPPEQNQQEQNKDQQQEQQQQEQKQPTPKPQEMTREQLETLLRKIQEREREYQEKRKAIQALLGRKQVERDW